MLFTGIALLVALLASGITASAATTKSSSPNIVQS
jgi:hypothetical protein